MSTGHPLDEQTGNRKALYYELIAGAQLIKLDGRPNALDLIANSYGPRAKDLLGRIDISKRLVKQPIAALSPDYLTGAAAWVVDAPPWLMQTEVREGHQLTWRGLSMPSLWIAGIDANAPMAPRDAELSAMAWMDLHATQASQRLFDRQTALLDISSCVSALSAFSMMLHGLDGVTHYESRWTAHYGVLANPYKARSYGASGNCKAKARRTWVYVAFEMRRNGGS